MMQLCTGFLTALLALLSLGPTTGDPDEGTEQPCISILANGTVLPAPPYPYEMHGYNFDSEPGDNDMPWLRGYAANHQIFAGINMNLDWKDREFAMMQAIIAYTSRTLPWMSTSRLPGPALRARHVLETNENFPEYGWGCGDVSAAAVGLAQAHGIPAQFVNGVHYQHLGGDFCVSMYSVFWNRWIFFFPKGGNWIEHESNGPLGIVQLHDYDIEGGIQFDDSGPQVIAVPYPPLVFQPFSVNESPLEPFGSELWWSGYFRHMRISTHTMPNKEIPEQWGSVFYVSNDGFINEAFPGAVNDPVVALNSSTFTMPLNNVSASVILTAGGFQIRLKNNMFGFTHYEAKSDDGPWSQLAVSDCEPGVDACLWQPAPTPSTIVIRGVNEAGVNSPDIVVTLHNRFVPGDVDGNGVTDGRDIQPFVSMLVSGRPPVGALICPVDIYLDTRIDDRDLRYFIELLADLSCPYPPIGVPPE